MKKAALICSFLLLSIIAVLAVSCGGGGGGAIAATGGNNAGKRGFGNGSGEVKVYVNGKLAGGSSGSSKSSGGSEEMPENASTASYSEGIMALGWNTMDFKLWVNGQLYFNQTLNKGDKFSIAGLKLGDSVRAEGNFYTSDGTPYLITGGIPSVQNGSKLSMYVTYTYTCNPASGGTPTTGYYTAEAGAALPAIQCLDGRTVLGWLNTTSGLSTDGKVWKSIPAGTTGNLTFALDVNKSYAGEKLFTVSGKMITSLTSYGETLNAIKIPEGVETIYSMAFNNNTNITSVSLPSTLTKIGSNAFEGCTSLSNVSFASGSKLKHIESKAFSGCTSLKAVTVPANVEIIGVQLFSNCTNLEKVDLAGTKIKTLSQDSFYGCNKLNSVSLPDSLETIDKYAFSSCSALRNITIPQNVNRINNFSFQNCTVTLTMKPLTPPVLESNAFSNPPVKIFVPGSALSAYKTAAVWLSYGGRIE